MSASHRTEPTLDMSSLFAAEPTLEDFTKLLSEPLTNGQSNGQLNGQSNGQSSGQPKNGHENGHDKAEPIEEFELEPAIVDYKTALVEESAPVVAESRQSVTTQEMQQVVRALTGLKSELKRAGLLEKTNVQSLFRQVAEFAAAQPKPDDPNQSVSTVKQLRYQRALLWGITSQMRQTTDTESLLKVAVKSIRETLQVDRLLICQVNSDQTGKIVAESLRRGWTPMMGETVALTCFGRERTEDYMTQPAVVIEDGTDLTPYQRQLLEQFQVKTSLSLPIIVAGQMWGLVVMQQCAVRRAWQETEISLLYQVSLELAVNLQKSEFELKIQHQAEQEKAVIRVINRIRQSLDIDTIFRTTTQEVRQLLKVDRVVVYRFNEDWSGEFIAESVATGLSRLVESDSKMVWKDTYLQETQGGRYRNNETFAVDDIYTAGHHQCHIDLLEQLEAKAYVVVPVFTGRKLWGLLAAYQSSGKRHWNESEVSFLAQISGQFGAVLQLAESLKNAQMQEERNRVLTNITDRIRQSLNIKTILRTTTQEVRQLLKADRVAVYRFNEDWSGEFVAESVGTGWIKLVGPDLRTVWEDTYLQETQGGRYRNGDTFAVEDIYQAGHYQCHLEVLEQFQVRAYVIVPVFTGQKLWGLLAAYQNSGPRHWEEADVHLLAQIGTQLGLPVQQAELISQIHMQMEAERAVNKVIDNIRQASSVDAIFRIAADDIRLLLKADRVGVYRFNEDWSGEFVAESVAEGWIPLMQQKITEFSAAGGTTTDSRCVIQSIQANETIVDTYLKDTNGGKYAKGVPFLQVDDVSTKGFSSCYLELLQKFQAKAYLTVPIFKEFKLWGLLACYQNSGPRAWKESEVGLLTQIGAQMSLALRQAELLTQTQQQAAREKILARVSDRVRKSLDIVRQSLDISAIFKVTTQEVRQLLEVDRVALYRFNPDWSGDFIAESVANGWNKLVGTEVGTNVQDTYLKENEGGRYQNRESLAVDDIYKAGHAPCHVELLEQFQARAYVLVPVFIGQQLWGILAAYQNSGPRHWEEADVALLNQIAIQMGVSLELASSLEQGRVQSEQLAQAAAREKSAKEQLQHQVIQLLAAVKPVFSGDLTVRVPVVENEVGTIADAYNNTIQSLRKIVTQVQTATVKVTQTSQNSGGAISQLTQQAEEQLQEVTRALDQIQAMVSSTQEVASNAQQVESAVQKANQTVRSGDAAMNRTVDGILAIRETVAETSKKIKRLSESSQKISKVVSLIGSFTTQTQLLALNASIEATRAGEYGRGFTVVADEVRSLARQSAEATREIEKLAQEIQSETSAVSVTMDTGIQQVVNGTTLVNETRQQLTEIINATAQISQLVHGITEATFLQTEQSKLVTQAMTDVATLANKNSAQSGQIAASFQELLTTAQQLQTSVGQFKVD